jgi:hypothetical protein
VVSRRIPWLWYSGAVRGAIRRRTLPALPQPAGNATRRWSTLRCSARRRKTLSTDPRVGRRVSVSNPAGADSEEPVSWIQRGARPTAEDLALGGDRSPDRASVVDSRAGHTREVEAERRRFVGPRPWKRGPRSTALPKRCRGARLLGCLSGRSCLEHHRNLQRPGCELGPPKRTEDAVLI